MFRRSVFYETECSTGYIKKEIVDKSVFLAVKDMIRIFLDDDSAISKCRKKLAASARNRQCQRQASMQKEKIKALEAKKTGLYKDFCRKLISEEDYLVLNARYSDEIKAASEMIEGLMEASAKEKKAATTLESVTAKLGNFKGKRKLSKEMVGSLIEKVIVYDEDKIEVVFQFDDELAKLMEGANKDDN